jgi:hypothetical protein
MVAAYVEQLGRGNSVLRPSFRARVRREIGALPAGRRDPFAARCGWPASVHIPAH